jgi:hypothetical protein
MALFRRKDDSANTWRLENSSSQVYITFTGDDYCDWMLWLAENLAPEARVGVSGSAVDRFTNEQMRLADFV